MVNNTIQNVLDRLKGVRPISQNQWQALCPAHDDHTPSLSVAIASDGKILLHCHAGCDHRKIVAQLGLVVGDLFTAPDSRPTNQKPSIRAIYNYRDLDGQTCYQVLRYSDKTFRFRRPDGQGGWIWNLQDTPKVLYRLPELMAAGKEQTIFIPEGEKDVDNLSQLGLTATCNPCGAGKWSSLEKDCMLYGRLVVILPDNDQAGRDHAADVARCLSVLCQEIRILELPGLLPKQDVSDWIEQQPNKTPKEIAQTLHTMTQTAPVWTPEFQFAGKSQPESPAPTLPIDWPQPQPIPDQMPVVMKFDTALLPDSLRPWIEDVADRMQCPVDFPAVTAILALSSIVGRKLAIRPKRQDNWTVIPNLWGMLVGRPSIMKSPPMKEILKPLKRLSAQAYTKYQEEWNEYVCQSKIDAIQEKAVSTEMAKAIRNGQSSESYKQQLAELSKSQPPIRRRYIVNDVTVEALGVILSQNPYGLLQERDELIGFLKSLERKGQDGARAFYLEAWNGNGHFETDRIGRGNVCINGGLCLSLIGTIQPGPLGSYIHQAVSGGGGDDGFIQRFQLAVWPDDPEDWQIVDRTPDRAAREMAWGLYESLDQMSPDSCGGQRDPFDENGVPFLRFDESAQELFYDWMLANENRLRSGSEHPALESHFAKYRSMIPSLALLIHLAHGGQGAVCREATEKALGWERYLASHARRIYGRGVDPEIWHAKALAEKILAGQVSSGFSLRDIYNKGWTLLVRRHEVLMAAEYLEELDWIRPEVIETAGRPRTHYRINPRVFES